MERSGDITFTAKYRTTMRLYKCGRYVINKDLENPFQYTGKLQTLAGIPSKQTTMMTEKRVVESLTPHRKTETHS